MERTAMQEADRPVSDSEHRDESLPLPPEARPFPSIERTIVEAVRRRESEALGQFFEHYFDRVFGLAFRLLGSRTAAEDATQEIFFKVHRAAHRIDPERDPAPWLITITLNTCRSYWRSATHRMSRRAVTIDSSPEPGPEIADPQRNPEEEFAAQQRERIVQEAILDLPETLREVVLLRDYQGLDHREIATVLQIGHDAVRKRYSRALAELGRLLQERIP
ncbi:MAG: sigma-70 family RNA polymerase sigma factor [Candidatus Eisenbacteria bacterium]|nr:sigma-70 family RNA polymerase sigma factor [Candidatus Latescibacterota bacterium]MBD3300868.1 sigma-70 family RNA polymerase sigma factor [Candidatus Eisenbacteria bacterium]